MQLQLLEPNLKRFRRSGLALAVAAAVVPAAPAAFATPSAMFRSGADGNGHDDSRAAPDHSKLPPGRARKALVTLQPDANSDIRRYLNDPYREPHMAPAAIEQLLRKKIKYVFVIFNENHSFDNEYGSFPGVNGLYSDGRHPRDAAHTPGFTQHYTDVATGADITVQPFGIGPDQNSSVVDSVDHSHTGLATKIDVDPATGVAAMDKFAYDEYHKYAPDSGASAGNQAKGKQFANLVMSHIDCDTIPFFWDWASHFTIFDNIFATEDTPSTPNAIAMIAGQSGETQWVKHPGSDPAHPTATGTTGPLHGTINGTDYDGQTGTAQGPPIVNDPQPWYGSEFDDTDPNSPDRQPSSPKESYGATNIASNLTFASVPLTLMGRDVTATMATNLNPAFDLPDIQRDIPYIQRLHYKPTGWRWYQEGYDHESSEPEGITSHVNYVSHHQGPQYFGYLANTPAVRSKLHGESDFFDDVARHDLPDGGVIYIRGGYGNQMGLTPAITNPNTPAAEVSAINNAKSGDDDHPSYTDRQISEAMAARVINAIAGNPYIWSKSAIIITYDESDGFYDHVPPRILSYGPDGLPLSRGVRVPLILISPYARTHAVSHAEGDHNSVIETINAIFGLPALASLPDEAQALKAGDSPYFNQFAPPGFHQKFLGPRDINSPITDSLLSGFDPKRLLGISPPLPAKFAKISDSVIASLPHYGGQGCSAIGITPEDQRQGIVNVIPAGFNNLPSTYPAANPPAN
jgi:phospholipase C